MDKHSLDMILERNMAQPVGDGYIDIIVLRDNYSNFIKDLIDSKFEITGISWWEWLPKDKNCEYGLGGPVSYYHDCWFAEIPIDIDDVDSHKYLNNIDLLDEIVKIVESKEINFSDETITFKKDKWLTPGIWLNVPDDWRSTVPNTA